MNLEHQKVNAEEDAQRDNGGGRKPDKIMNASTEEIAAGMISQKPLPHRSW